MISYMKSELYRLFHGKGSYLFILICTALLVSANVVLAVVDKTEKNFPYATIDFAMGLYYTSIVIIYLLCVTVASIVFGNEYSNHTMKNSISYGIPRGSIYFGKFLTELIYALIAFTVITGIDIGSAYLLLDHSNNGPVRLLLETCFVTLPLLFSALAVTNCFLFLLEGTGGAIAAIVGTIIAFPLVCNMLAMKFSIFAKLAKILPWNMINKIGFDTEKYQLILPWEGNTGYYYYWISGMVWMLIFTLAGYLVFRTKEVK